MSAPFRLRSGDTGPVQQSPVTCGSASLTVARMLVDPVFARWITEGEGSRLDAPPGATREERFAAYERVVMRRTNSLRSGGGRVNIPWPRMFGTPPWGARKELEFGASKVGTEYETELLREETRARLAASHAHLVQVVADGEPALLYVGNAWLPRHVVLVIAQEGSTDLDVYDPASGRVTALERDRFAGRRLGLSGWNHPWIVIQPTGLRKERVGEARTAAAASSPVRPTSAGAFSRNGSSAGSAR